MQDSVLQKRNAETRIKPLLEQIFQGYCILEYTAILIVSQSERGDKDRVYRCPHIICRSKYSHSPFHVIIVLFLHGVVTVIKLHLTHVNNFVCPFYDKVYLYLFLCRLGCYP